MGNALIGVPYEVSYVSASFAGDSPVSNVLNDEPGLVYSAEMGSTDTAQADFLAGTYALYEGAWTYTTSIDLTLKNTATVEFASVLWYNDSLYVSGAVQFRWKGYTTVANRDADNPAYNSGLIASPELSANRTAESAKHLHILSTPTYCKYWRLDVYAPGAFRNFRPWRILLGKVIQPPDNIEAGPENSIDDRSDRRYSRTGRRVIDPTVICPTFKGTWPWIDDGMAKQDFRPLMYSNGGSYPVLFVLDPDDTSWGEDAFFYGDLEKNMTMVPEEAGLWSFTFAIVSIAP